MPNQVPDTSLVAPITAAATPIDPSADSFHNLGIAPQILKSLDYYGFTVPTPIQRDAIPVAATGSDVIGIAQTGTGKTLAFGIPTVQHLMLQGGQALIVVPTRELAIQVEESIMKVSRPLHMWSVVLIGGESMYRQVRRLERQVDIVIATPGRLIDHLKQGNLKLDKVRIVILDEADRMLDMGFAPQIAELMSHVPKERQTLLFSATMPNEILSMTARYQKDPIRVEVAKAGTANEHITQELVVVPRQNKAVVLEEILKKYTGSVLVFSRTKHGARNLTMALRHDGHQAMEIHSDRSLAQRRQALDAFKAGRCRVLVATDIAARGIDVTGISLVVNYDLPDNPDDYVHRIGRTGRAGAVGHAISFATPDQGKDVRDIERLMRTEFPLSDFSQTTLSYSGGSSGPRNNRSFGGRRRDQRPDHRPDQRSEAPRFSRPDRPQNNDRPYNRDHQEARPSTSAPRDGAFTSSISAPKGFVVGKKPARRPFKRR